MPIVYPRAGDVWRTGGGVTLRFIGLSLPFIGGKNAINDNSIAFILQYPMILAAGADASPGSSVVAEAPSRFSA